MTGSSGNRAPDTRQGWQSKNKTPADSPYMTLEFARAYEQAATRIMAPISFAVLSRIGPIARGIRLLDIAAGTGALSIPAAHAGASVTAIDIAPGMVELLTERLLPFPTCQVQAMDGQSLAFADGSFDATVSVAGTGLFQDWKRGLAEQARVLRSGGRAAIATWRTLPGGGPFIVMARALRALYPDRPPPAAPEGFVALSDPDRMREALREAGLADVEVEVIDAVWDGPAGHAYIDELSDFHPYMGPYATLDADARTRLHDAILTVIEDYTTGGRVVLTTPVTLGIGTRP